MQIKAGKVHLLSFARANHLKLRQRESGVMVPKIRYSQIRRQRRHPEIRQVAGSPGHGLACKYQPDCLVAGQPAGVGDGDGTGG